MSAQNYFYFDNQFIDSTKTHAGLFETVLNRHPLLIEASRSKEPVPEKPKLSENKSGVFLLVVGLLLFVGILRSTFDTYIAGLWSVIVNFSVIKRQTKELIQNNFLASAGFRLLFFIGLSLLIMAFMSQKAGAAYSCSFTSMNFWLSMALLLGLYFLKLGFLTGLGRIYNKPEASDIYFFNSNVMNEAIGLLIFPIAVLMFLLSGFVFQLLMFICTAILVSLIAYKNIKIFKGVKNLLRISAFDYLLYLCAFEIMPLMILLKVLSKASF